MRTFLPVVPGIRLLKIPFNDGSYDTGAYLVQSGGQTALIDSGECAATVDSCILPALQEAGVSAIDWLLCSHTHGDHAGGHERLCEVLGCRTAVFEGDAVRFPVNPDRILHDGEYPIPGLRLIATPGHMPGAVSYLHEESGTLITGDSVQGSGTDGVGLALIEDPAAYRASIARIMGLRPLRMACGHGFAPCDFIIEGPMRVRAFLQCSLDTLARYEAFVARHLALDDHALAAMLVDSEERTLERYIVRGDGTVTGCRQVLRSLSTKNQSAGF